MKISWKISRVKNFVKIFVKNFKKYVLDQYVFGLICFGPICFRPICFGPICFSNMFWANMFSSNMISHCTALNAYKLHKFIFKINTYVYSNYWSYFFPPNWMPYVVDMKWKTNKKLLGVSYSKNMVIFEAFH